VQLVRGDDGQEREDPLTHKTAFSRRKIYSEEKCRPRTEQPTHKQTELLTFYQPRKEQS
jgi:hypothetical protein